MAFNYAALRDGPVKSAIDTLGQALTLRKRVQGAYDPDTQQQAIVVTDYACKGVIYDGRGRIRQGDNIVTRSERRAFVSASGLSVAPVIADEIVVASGEVFAIAEIRQTVDPGGTVVGWELALGS